MRDREDGLGGESERKGREWEDQRDHDRGRVRSGAGVELCKKWGEEERGGLGKGKELGAIQSFYCYFNRKGVDEESAGLLGVDKENSNDE